MIEIRFYLNLKLTKFVIIEEPMKFVCYYFDLIEISYIALNIYFLFDQYKIF